jgi:ribose 5-phosphate isomerase B
VFGLKQKVEIWLIKEGYKVRDLGAHRLSKNDDYPDFGAKVGRAVSRSPESRGILFCGSAEGICIAANKIKGIRAVPIWNTISAHLSREHNDANVLCLSGGKMRKPIPELAVSFTKAKSIIKIWLTTSFSNEERHVRRIKKIRAIER